MCAISLTTRICICTGQYSIVDLEGGGLRGEKGVCIIWVLKQKSENGKGEKVTGPCCRLGTYQSRRVWSRGQRA